MIFFKLHFTIEDDGCIFVIFEMHIFLADDAVWSPTSCWNYATTCYHNSRGARSWCRQVWSTLILWFCCRWCFSVRGVLLNATAVRRTQSWSFFLQIPCWLHQRPWCRFSLQSSISWADHCQKLPTRWLLGARGARWRLPILSGTPFWGNGNTLCLRLEHFLHILFIIELFYS